MLSIKNVHKRFGDVHAMNNINLDLAPGLFGLLGPNGAGKSTLMRTLATLQNPDEGIITYKGEDITKNPETIFSDVLRFIAPGIVGDVNRVQEAIENVNKVTVEKSVPIVQKKSGVNNTRNIEQFRHYNEDFFSTLID